LIPNTLQPTYKVQAVSFAAYAEETNKPPGFRGNMWKVWLVGGDCFLIGLAPVLVHMAKNADGKYAFSPISVNLLVEIAKTIFALVTLLLYGTGRPGAPLYRSLTSFARDAAHNKLLAIPAFLYAVNNYLKFAIQLYFKPTTAKMLSNLKIIVIALLMKNVLNRSFSVFQWEALFLLVAGITVNQLNSCGGDGSNGDVITPAAIAYTLGSITIPSLASVYNEFALKRHMETSVLLQNFFLYFYGACFNFIGLLVVTSISGVQSSSIFAGFSGVTVLLVVNNALQGILSSFFFKYADTILKKYSSTIATIFTGLMSALLFGHELTINFCIGVSIVFISMHIFFSLGKTLVCACSFFLRFLLLILCLPSKGQAGSLSICSPQCMPQCMPPVSLCRRGEGEFRNVAGRKEECAEADGFSFHGPS
jgi:UDP-galactose transporter